MTTATATREVGSARRWSILAVSMLAALSTACVVNGGAFLIPELQRSTGISLPTGSTLAMMASVGLMITTVPWGAALDRYGERAILLLSLAGTVVATVGAVVAAAMSAPIWVLGMTLLLAGASAASTNGAGGRIVVGWFPAEQRGTAMGIRQMAQPLGVGVVAMTVPVLAHHFGLAAGIAVFPIVAAVALVLSTAVIVDPPQSTKASGEQVPNPYRHNNFLWRVHGVSVLLVIPQMALWTFVPVWLMVERGWAPATAGVLVTGTQIVGALGRIAAGRWSDQWGSRMRPIRIIAAAAAISTMALAVTDFWNSPAAIVIMVVASVITVADNGLAFTSIAEFAGPSWSGRALAIQNTMQYLVGSAAVPLIATTIDDVGYPLAFAIVAITPLIALPLVPRDPK
ncbi:putative major facilitator superfamily transporter [Gordonia effusa NBRC 100432]|uniref:Putative major facilitator superfamily transporter n=1 Tax=Gordonia effusa NBRC 100432 TaxID=1077974 RepID=H0QZY1_9ACTN|nr:MFS transporter [Gordonia effusa]GAB18382.1 putative major facilitator superfamily transporter [Gordonia effusa NBRC 100432]